MPYSRLPQRSYSGAKCRTITAGATMQQHGSIVACGSIHGCGHARAPFRFDTSLYVASRETDAWSCNNHRRHEVVCDGNPHFDAAHACGDRPRPCRVWRPPDRRSISGRPPMTSTILRAPHAWCAQRGDEHRILVQLTQIPRHLRRVQQAVDLRRGTSAVSGWNVRSGANFSRSACATWPRRNGAARLQRRQQRIDIRTAEPRRQKPSRASGRGRSAPR